MWLFLFVNFLNPANQFTIQLRLAFKRYIDYFEFICATFTVRRVDQYHQGKHKGSVNPRKLKLTTMNATLSKT